MGANALGGGKTGFFKEKTRFTVQNIIVGYWTSAGLSIDVAKGQVIDRRSFGELISNSQFLILPKDEDKLLELYSHHEYIHRRMHAAIARQPTELYPSIHVSENYAALTELISLVTAHNKSKPRLPSGMRMSAEFFYQSLDVFSKLFALAQRYSRTQFNQTILDPIRIIAISADIDQQPTRYSTEGAGNLKNQYFMKQSGDVFITLVQDFMITLAQILERDSEIDERIISFLKLSRMEKGDAKSKHVTFEQTVATFLMTLAEHASGPDVIDLGEKLQQLTGLERIGKYLRDPDVIPSLRFCDSYAVAAEIFPPSEKTHAEESIWLEAVQQLCEEIGIDNQEADSIFSGMTLAGVVNAIGKYQEKHKVSLNYGQLILPNPGHESGELARNKLELKATRAERYVNLYCTITVETGTGSEARATVLKCVLSYSEEDQSIDFSTNWRRSPTHDRVTDGSVDEDRAVDEQVVLYVLKNLLLLYSHISSQESAKTPVQKPQLQPPHTRKKEKRKHRAVLETQQQLIDADEGKDIALERALELRSKKFPLQLLFADGVEDDLKKLDPSLQRAVGEFVEKYNATSGLGSNVTSLPLEGSRFGELRLANLPNRLHDYRFVYVREGRVGRIIDFGHRKDIY